MMAPTAVATPEVEALDALKYIQPELIPELAKLSGLPTDEIARRIGGMSWRYRSMLKCWRMHSGTYEGPSVVFESDEVLARLLALIAVSVETTASVAKRHLDEIAGLQRTIPRRDF